MDNHNILLFKKNIFVSKKHFFQKKKGPYAPIDFGPQNDNNIRLEMSFSFCGEIRYIFKKAATVLKIYILKIVLVKYVGNLCVNLAQL
jgi:hypothetical protein